ncbi:MAG: hypothetical protein JXR94_11520, partial [Candidatus Hydrogenedentes bacterium]|nr:hypothetical protein [Candidatus Hydrogenedentota bacterium]
MQLQGLGRQMRKERTGRRGRKAAMGALAICAPLAFALPLCGFEAAAQETPANLIQNGSFDEGASDAGVPAGWSLYGGQGVSQSLSVVELAEPGGNALVIADGDPAAEIGVSQKVAVQPETPYLATVQVQVADGASPLGSYLQLRFLPSNEFVQMPLRPGLDKGFTPIEAGRIAPAGTTHAVLYLYTHRDPTPQVIVDDVRLTAVKELPKTLNAPQVPSPPDIIQLKELYLETALVQDGAAAAVIVVPASGIYDDQAQAIADAIEARSGVKTPIVPDTAPEAGVPLTGNVIVLGNRSTNALICKLYDLYYTLLDLRYPGPKGYVLRTLHNPFGNGLNAVLVGGSDAEGVAQAAQRFAETLAAVEAGDGALTVGRLMEIELGDGIAVPTDLRGFEIWEASAGYGSTGYFGWNSISKRMAMYYMTGDEFQAREAIRLAFPDEQAKSEIAEIDGERIENKDDPLGGPYHYNAHMMILFWDLIEESPAFTDEERLRVTQAFTRQLNHPGIRSAYAGPFAGAPGQVGSRHGQWTAISLYCLGRYFAKDYGDPVWPVCEENGARHFRSLHEHAWVSGENDNLFWYSTAIAPIFTYLTLTGDRVPLENGVVPALLRGQEMLISGRVPDWALNSASMGFLHKAAYLTGDGRWLEYRNRTGVNLEVFRLGQSYWPDDTIEPALPVDLAGSWQVNPLPKPMWEWRGSGLPLDESFLFMSYRSRADARGDYVLLDGFNGASRNPYHTFAILELRVDGATLLEGYLNQVLTRVDGLVEPQIAMDAALRHRNVIGETAVAVGEVPKAAFATWRRSLVQRIGQYAVIVDELESRTDSENFEIQIKWESRHGAWQADPAVAGRIRLTGAQGACALPPGWLDLRALDAECRSEPAGPAALVDKPGLGCMLLRAQQPGDWLEMEFNLEQPVSGETQAGFLRYADRGIVRVLVDGVVQLEEVDLYAPSSTSSGVSLGSLDLAKGRHVLRLEVIGKHAGSSGYLIALEGITFKTDTAGEPPVPVVCISEPTDTAFDGPKATMTWTGPLGAGQTKRFFSVVQLEPDPAGHNVRAARLSDTAAAACLDGEPALIVAGEHGDTAAGLAVLDAGHLYGRNIAKAGGVFAADTPVEIDWSLAAGEATVKAPQATRIGFASDSTAVTLDAQPAGASGRDGALVFYTVPAGEHRFSGVICAATAAHALAERLQAALDAADEARAEGAASTGPVIPSTPALDVEGDAAFAEGIVDLEFVPTDGTPLLCAAEGRAIHVLQPDGTEVKTLETDGPIRMLRWWDEYRLLLAGCADEKVIAFEGVHLGAAGSGARKWVFVSEMHPDVFRAAKTYWFKSAPGHEGIHG